MNEEIINLSVDNFNNDIKPAGESESAKTDLEDFGDFVEGIEEAPEVEAQPVEVDPRISFVEDVAKQYDMTPEEYISAVKEQERENEVIALMQQGVEEEAAYEILDARESKAQAEEQTKMKKQQDDAMYMEFMDDFREATGREFRPGEDEIPVTVWLQVEQGKPLKEAYNEHKFDAAFLKGFDSL
jgi:hypothetical protein